MNTIEATILGLIQGLTEFLPISSSAHLILVPQWMHWEDPGLAFDVALHLGTLAALLLFFWRDWFAICQNFYADLSRSKYNPVIDQQIRWSWLVLGTIPGVIFGLIFQNAAENAFRNPQHIALALILFGLALGIADLRQKTARTFNDFHYKHALAIGFAQALAIIPGVSRSGITITAGLIIGLTRPAAMRFSFLLSAPIIAGAGLIKAPEIFRGLASGGDLRIAILLGFISSLGAGLFAIELLRRLIQTKSFMPFVVYRVILGSAILFYSLIRI